MNHLNIKSVGVLLIGSLLVGMFLRFSTTKYITYKVSSTMESASNDVEFLASFLPIVCEIKTMEQEVASLEIKGNRLERIVADLSWTNISDAVGELSNMASDVEDIYDQVEDIQRVVQNAEAYDANTRQIKQDILHLINVIDAPVNQAITLKSNLLNGRWLISIGAAYNLYNSLANIEHNYTNAVVRIERSMESYSSRIEDNLETAYGKLSPIAHLILKVIYFGNEEEIVGTIIYDSFIEVAMGSKAFANAYNDGCLETAMEELRTEYMKDIIDKKSKGQLARIDNSLVPGLNVRASCDFGSRSNIIQELTPDSRFEIIKETGSCFQISYKGKKGYVSKKYVLQ